MNKHFIIIITALLFVFIRPVQAQYYNCDTIDGKIAEEMQLASADFAKANDLAVSIQDKGTMNAVAEVAAVLNPIPSVQSAAADGFWSVCASVIGQTVTKGITATKTALEISFAIGSNQIAGVEGMISSNRKTGRVHLQKARDLLEWKKDNCDCETETESPPSIVVNEDSTVTEEDPSGGLGQILNGDGVSVKFLPNNSVEITSVCSADDKRIQMRTTGTWSTKSQNTNSVIVEGLRVGIKYELRHRCGRQYSEVLQFELPGSDR